MYIGYTVYIGYVYYISVYIGYIYYISVYIGYVNYVSVHPLVPCKEFCYIQCCLPYTGNKTPPPNC